MDINTIIVVGIVVFLIILLYVYYTSRRTPSKAVEQTKLDSVKVVEPPKPTVRAVAEPPIQASTEAVEPRPEARPVVEPPRPVARVVRAPEPVVEPAPVIELDPETVEPVPEAKEVVEPSRPGQNIIDIEGIGPTYAAKLNSVGIKTTTDLLEAGSTRKGREELAEKTGITPRLILEWVNLADLFRIRGIGEEYSDLLEEAGVDTVVELATRNPENLHAKIVEINEEKKMVRRVMSLGQVRNWVEQAKQLPRKVEY